LNPMGKMFQNASSLSEKKAFIWTFSHRVQC
jgi:hypothetical protein